MRLIKFRISGDFGHFCNPGTSTFMATHPAPPRTALMGIVGAILGMNKDTPQVLLDGAYFAVQGKVPRTVVHGTNYQKKELPIFKPEKDRINPNDNWRSGPYKPFMSPTDQELLIKPEYIVFAGLPDPYHDQFRQQLIEEQYHYGPCMGLAYMFAQVEFLGDVEVEKLPPGTYDVSTIVRETPTTKMVFPDYPVAFRGMYMPRIVTSDREFRESSKYQMHREGKTLPFQTDEAWKVDDQVITFL